MKVYLDNTVVSAIARDDMPKESVAIGKILTAYDAGSLELWTSKFTAEEIGNAPVDKSKPIKNVYLLLEKVPHVERQVLRGFNMNWDLYTSISSPMIEEDPVWVKLKKTGLDGNDAYHAMLAIKANCDVFLTTD